MFKVGEPLREYGARLALPVAAVGALALTAACSSDGQHPEACYAVTIEADQPRVIDALNNSLLHDLKVTKYNLKLYGGRVGTATAVQDNLNAQRSKKYSHAATYPGDRFGYCVVQHTVSPDKHIPATAASGTAKRRS